MPFDFPYPPTENQVFTPPGGPTYVFKSPAWTQASVGSITPPTAQARNRIVNGAMQISQELGDSGSAASATYALDQWQMHFGTAPMQVGAAHILTTTPSGNPHSLLLNIYGAKPSLAAGDYATVLTLVEGIRVSDFGWGVAGAKQAVLRFAVKAPFAGTFSVAVRNNAIDRVFLAPFTIAAGEVNTYVVRSIVIPGDTTGAWLTNVGVGMSVFFVVACGTTFQGVAGWQAGSKLGVTGMTNGAAATGMFYFSDVGLYLDPDNTGLPPKWQMPDEAEELRACRRYWQRLDGWIVDTNLVSPASTFLETMRITPAFTGGGTGFGTVGPNPSHAMFYQTTRGIQTLVLSARM